MGNKELIRNYNATNNNKCIVIHTSLFTKQTLININNKDQNINKSTCLCLCLAGTSALLPPEAPLADIL